MTENIDRECQVCDMGIVTAHTRDGEEHAWACPDCKGKGYLPKEKFKGQLDAIEAARKEQLKVRGMI